MIFVWLTHMNELLWLHIFVRKDFQSRPVSLL